MTSNLPGRAAAALCLSAALAPLASTAATPARANPPAAPAPAPAATAFPYYVEGALGNGKVDVSCSAAPTCDRSGTGLKLIGGMVLTPRVAAEVSYLDFSKASLGFGALGSATVKASGLALGVAGNLPITHDWSVLGRFGIARIQGRLSQPGLSTSDSAFNPYFGLGASVQIKPALSVGVAYDTSKVELNGSDGDVSLWSIGVRYRF